MYSAWFTESKSVCWETTKVSKVVFSSLFFFHRITVKPSPRQLDQGALLANFLHKRTLCSVCAIFFFFNLLGRRFKPFFGSRGFFFCFRLFECCCVFFFFIFILFFLLCFIICFMNLTVYVVVGNLFLFLVFIFWKNFMSAKFIFMYN